METDDAKELFRRRPGLVEYINAVVKGRMKLTQFPVRGIARVACVALLTAIATNLVQHARMLLS